MYSYVSFFTVTVLFFFIKQCYVLSNSLLFFFPFITESCLLLLIVQWSFLYGVPEVQNKTANHRTRQQITEIALTSATKGNNMLSARIVADWTNALPFFFKQKEIRRTRHLVPGQEKLDVGA